MRTQLTDVAMHVCIYTAIENFDVSYIAMYIRKPRAAERVGLWG